MLKNKLIKNLFVITFFLSFLPVVTETAVFEIGGKTGWNNILFSKNIKIRNGKFGYNSLTLTSSPSKISEKTDMYLSFDFADPVEETGTYILSAYSTVQSGVKSAKFGEGAGIFSSHSETGGITLKPEKGAFFFGDSAVHSFTIEFWIRPQVTENGSLILKWWSSLNNTNATMFQNITAGISKNKMEWSFFNIWQNKNKGLDIKLAGKNNVIPETWSHHLVTYNENTGLLEYRMNGKVEDIRYLTETEKEGSQILYSMLGTCSDVIIGSKYTGLIDEFKITGFFSEQGMPWEIHRLFEKYAPEGGRAESNLIDTHGNKSCATILKADCNLPEQTDAEFFIRAADNPFNWNDDFPVWKPVILNQKIKNVKGRYFQLACSLYPNSDGNKTPFIHSITLEYEKDEPPLPPSKIIAKPMNGSVFLSWSPSVSFDVKGYLIYFGEQKGEYFAEGSPIDAGNNLNFKIDNLKNGKIYFFAVAAYDEPYGEHAGEISKEAWARPMQSKNK